MPSSHNKRNLLRFGLVISTVLLVLLTGLWFNIQAVSLNRKIHTLKEKLAVIQQENRGYEERISFLTRLSNIEAIAKDQLEMVPTTKVHYFKASSDADD